MLRRALIVPIVLALASISASAKHDFEYAIALAEKLRYYDMAEAELKKLMDNPQHRARAEFWISKILVIQARREVDPIKKVASFDQALAKMESLLGGSGMAQERFDVGELYIEKAKVLLERAEKESDKADPLKSEARAAFDKAIAIFGQAAGTFQKQTDDEAQVFFRRSTYYVIECEFEKAVTYPLGNETRNKILKDLRDKIESFCWDNEDYIEAYYAYTILGQALGNLVDKKAPREEDLADAFAAFDSALSIPVNDATEWCRTLAYSRYMGECNRLGFFDRVVTLSKAMRKEYPNVDDLNFGQAAVIEEAKAYFGKRELGAAMAVIGKIAQKRSLWGSKAQLLLGKWKEITGSQQSPDEAYLVAEGLRRERSYWPAVRNYQLVIDLVEKAKKPDLTAKYSVLCWENMANCFQRLGLAYETYHALTEASVAAQQLKDTNKAAENAYYAFRAIKSRSYASEAESDKQLAEKSREYFLANFPRSPFEPGIRLQLARDLEEAAKYDEAVAAYERIDKQTEFYEEAISRVGICHYRRMKQHVDSANGQVDQAARDLGARALEAIDRYLTYIEKKPAGAAVEEKRQELLGQVIYYRASVYDKLEDHTKLLESLKDFESRFEKADANLLGAAIQMRIKATLGMSQAAADAGNSAEHARLLDLATKDLDVIKNVAGNTSYAGFAYQRIGFAYIALADKVREADLDAARRHERDAVKYLVPWVLRGGSLKYEHVKFVGLKCYLLGRDGDMDYTRQAARILEEAVARFPTEVETERNETDPAKQIDLKYFLAETLFKTQQWAKAVSMLRADYQKNPDSVFAIRSLGRCYYEIARQGKLDQEKYDTLIRESRLEDLGLQKAFVRIAAGGDPRKRDWMRKLAVYRSSRLFDESMQLSSGGKNALSTKDYDAYQRQWLALDDAKIAAELEKRINEYYISKLRQLQGLTEARAIALEAVLFALDRSIYYYRTVGNNTKRQSPEWWWSKYYVLASQYEQGRAHHLADPEAGAVYTQGSRILKDAEKTAENLIMLYPKLGCTEEKPDEADPEIAAAITKLRDDIKTQVSGSR